MFAANIRAFVVTPFTMFQPHQPAFSHRPSTARAYRCVCGAQVFFRNNACLQCGRGLGFDPWLGQVLAIEPDGEALSLIHI